MAAFSGLGNPEGFRRTLKSLPLTLAAWREYPDHHAYTHNDWRELAQWAEGHRALPACTQKDLVKLPEEADCWRCKSNWPSVKAKTR